MVRHFSYMNRSLSVHWNTHERAERRTLSALGRLVPNRLMCAFNVMEAARDRCCVRILDYVRQATGVLKIEV